MKILISNDGYSAFFYIRTGLARAFSACGHQVSFWNIHDKPVFDAFDEFEPDLFLGQTYNTTDQVCRAITERPHLKVIMKGADWGYLIDETDLDKYGLLAVQQQETERILKLQQETGKPDFLHIHYHADWMYGTHGHWMDRGMPVYSILTGADIFDYTGGQHMPVFECDMAFVGGYWPYKAQVINPYLLRLCYDTDYRIKLYGNAHWPVPQYCGMIDTQYVKHATASATICPCLYEPHAGDLGFDMAERPFKLLSNKCFIISNYVESMHRLLPDSIVTAKSPEEFQDKVDYYLANPDERLPFIQRGYDEVMAKHTYFHRIQQIFKLLKMEDEADKCMTTLKHIIETKL